MTTLQGRETTIRVSGTSIVLGALIGVGYCIGLAVLGGADAMSIGLERLELPVGFKLLLFSFFAVVVLSFAYFIAGFVAAKVSHQQYRFDSILHSLGTWSALSLLLMVLIVIASMLQTARGALATMNIPPVVTRVSLLPAEATTKVEPPRPAPKPTPEEEKADFSLLVAWWIACVSLLAGGGTSIVGGLVGRRKALVSPGSERADLKPANESGASAPRTT